MIPKDVVEQIRETAQVDEVVGDFVNMRKRGTNFLALCPFHDEKTPSFTISPSKNIYKCFGCGKSGDAVRFLMDHEHFSFPEALRYLAKKYGIEVPEETPDPEQQQALDHKESIYAVLSFAEQYYHELLEDATYGKPIGKAYLTERGINAESIHSYKLGMSPQGWDSFTRHALQNAFKEEFLVAAGLSIKTEKGNLIDRFRERIMFPIHSIAGRTLGFGGRILVAKSKKEAKYINSPDTEVYNKSEVLYGIFQAKKAIRQLDECLLVEGYTDVIALHQKGIAHVVAASGTSLTQGQLKLLKRFTNNICFLFDGDAAGTKASLRAIDLALEEGLNVYALQLPEGQDPDSFVQAHDKQEVDDYLATEKQDFILFKTQLLLPGTERDPLKKTEAISDIVHSIALIPSHLKRSVYVQQCSDLLRIDEEALIAELNKQLSKHLKNKRRQQARENDDDETVDHHRQEDKPAHHVLSHIPLRENEAFGKWQERFLVEFLFKYGDLEMLKAEDDEDAKTETVAEHIFNFMEEYDAEPDDEMLQSLCSEYRQQIERTGQADMPFFLQHENEELRHLAIDLLEERYKASENWVKKIGMEIRSDEDHTITLNKVVNRYKLARLQELIRQVMQKLKQAESDDELRILKTMKKLLSLRKEVADNLGISVI